MFRFLICSFNFGLEIDDLCLLLLLGFGFEGFLMLTEIAPAGCDNKPC